MHLVGFSKFEILQFRVTLLDVKPPVWRVIQVPETYTFWDLHVAIQDAMGWNDSHLHQFTVWDPESGVKLEIGLPDDDPIGPDETLPGWEFDVSDFLNDRGTKFKYVYDFGDDWRHSVEYEGSYAAEPEAEYPRCVKGKRQCPPDDCGGVSGYERFLEAIQDPKDEEHEDMLEWIGGSFDPEEFDPEAVEFDDPRERIKNLGFDEI